MAENPFMNLPAAPARQPQNFGKADSFIDSMALGAKKRAAGIGELGLKLAEGFGIEGLEPYREDLADLQKRYESQGKGTGFKGLVAEGFGDAFTYIPIAGGAANIGKGLVGGGILSGITRGTGEKDSGLESNVANAAIDSVVSLVTGKTAQKLLKPIAGNLDDVARKNIEILRDEGIDLTAAQRSQSGGLAALEETFKNLPFTATKQKKIVEKQLGQFTKQALKKAGIEADRATPEVLDEAAKEFSKRFDDMLAGQGVKIDEGLLQSLVEVEDDVTRRLGKDASKTIGSYLDDIITSFNNNSTIDAVTYQNTRSALGKLSKSSDTMLGNAAKKLQSALDDAAFRSAPEKFGKLRDKLYKEYGAFKAIENAMGTTTQTASSGLLTPAKILQGAKKGNQAFSRGGGAAQELQKLARAGQDVLPSGISDSGTPVRQFMQELLTGGGLAGVGFGTAGPIGAGTALAAPKVLQTIYGAKPVQSYLSKGITESIIPSVAAARGAVGAMNDVVDVNGDIPEPSPTATENPFMNLQSPTVVPETIPDTTAPIGMDTIKQHEGLRLSAYDDTVGKRTVGYGFNMQSGIARKVWDKAGVQSNFVDVFKGKATITPQEAENLMRASYDVAADDARKVYSNFDRLSPSQQTALMSMSYQLGLPKLKKFTTFNKAIERGDLNTAITALRKTLLAQQTPGRVEEISKLLLRSS